MIRNGLRSALLTLADAPRTRFHREMSAPSIRLHPDDNVAIQMHDGIVSRGHKTALTEIASGQPIIKYGQVVAIATKPISKGEHVHVQNVRNPSSSEALPFTTLA